MKGAHERRRFPLLEANDLVGQWSQRSFDHPFQDAPIRRPTNCRNIIHEISSRAHKRRDLEGLPSFTVNQIEAEFRNEFHRILPLEREQIDPLTRPVAVRNVRANVHRDASSTVRSVEITPVRIGICSNTAA